MNEEYSKTTIHPTLFRSIFYYRRSIASRYTTKMKELIILEIKVRCTHICYFRISIN